MSRRVDTLGGPSEPPQWATDFSGSEMRGPGESSTLSHVPRAASDITPSVPMASHLSGDSIPSAYSESFTIRRHPPDRVVSGQFYALETDPEPESGELLRESPLHSPVESLERDSDGENDNGQRKKKRTRVLMTHQQQATLSKLWRATKFPGTGEREAVAKQVGLTGRQVQVWFQSSPRSRRLTLEATKAADRDRVTAWAAESGAATGYLGVSLEEGADRASDVDEDGEEPDWSLSQSASHAESSRRLSRSDRPNRASTMWELDEDERLQAFSHPHRHPQPSPHRLSPKSSTRRESNLHGPLDAPVSCRPLAGRSGGAFQSYARSPSLNDPWTLRPSPQSVTSPLSPALPPLPHHSHSAPNPTKKDSLPQLNNHSRPQSFDGTRPSELPPSLVNLTLTGPMAHEVAGGRSRDSFHSLAVHHYDHVPSRSGSLTTSSPAMPGYHPEPELSRSRTDSARTSRTGPLTESHSSRDWFRSSLNSDRKWSEGSVMMSQDGDINMSARGVQPDQAFKCQSGPTIASVGADGTHQIMSKFAQSPVDLEMRKSSDTKPTQYRSQPGSPLKHLGSRNEATSNKRKSFEMPLPPSNNGVWDRLTSASLPSNRSEGERAQQLNTVSESSAKRDLPSFRDMFR
ncbi:hypothetical protein BD324DRAFT_609858 [Kockovaella imperatae]|uniref:Homeobox domain-containing protein n=1 Tax=Kockovaella imperatae TaxID=4999 RepID=A0A1Y1U9E7_9TREE|nr:hypothetical protein BD324DRAFT_609858 [Kockovaella imperatae]ORX34653.1 hypothetical protein BD324DRAFT_609858 [Kockovaella imperatae]